MGPFISAFLFLIAAGLLLFLPGWLVLRAVFGKRPPFIGFEALILSFGVSIGLIDFLMILLGKAGFPLSALSLAIGIIASLALLQAAMLAVRRLRKNEKTTEAIAPDPFMLGPRHGILFILLIALTLLIKAVYLAHAVLPTATDLGHHMYWAKLIAVTGELPAYAKQEIITAAGTYALTAPQPIADFIIGEHLPFAAISIFTSLDFFSAFPVMLLLLVNLLALLALFVLAWRFAADMRPSFLAAGIFTPQNVALATLFFFGPLYTLASPQAKFVSGGVVGNTFGNLFIPLILLILYRALKEKRSDFLVLAFFLAFTLAYTHHLSALVLLFVLGASLLAYAAVHFQSIGRAARMWIRLIVSPGPLLVVFFAALFFFLVAMPTYIETNAVGTALGTPTKTTRTGLSFFQTASSVGEIRVALGLAGLLLLLFLRKYWRYSGALLLGWCIVLLIMTMRPEWLFIDIPSNRIVTYLSFPLGLLAALASVAFFAALRALPSAQMRLPGMLLFASAFAVFVFAAGSGSSDNSRTLLPASKGSDALQTFTASRYLAEQSGPEDIILKDHNYIAADSWMKLFFLRDYAYPLSRGFFKRYEDNPDREQCTLLMISVPNTARGEKCYDELGVDLVVVNPHFDTEQFEKSQKFSRIYASEDIHIYERKK